MEWLIAQLGLDLVNDWLSGDAKAIESAMFKTTAKLRAMGQEKVDKAMALLQSIPGASNFVGQLKTKVANATKKARDKVAEAQKEQMQYEAAAADAEQKATDYKNQGVLGKIFAPNVKQAAQSTLSNVEKLVENKA